MLDAYRKGKDLYAQIAAIAFHSTYELCLEHFPKDLPIKQHDDGYWYPCEPGEKPDKYADGETDVYHDGKERRSQAKRILLGIMYGRGEKSIAEQLGCTVEEAKLIKNDVYDGFPAIKNFEDSSLRMAREKGYVTTLWGRKRRLPEIQLPNFEFFYLPAGVEPTDYEHIFRDENRIPDIEADGYKTQLLNATHYREKDKLIQKWKERGIIVKNNEGKIADATRQVINSRVQGCLDGETRIQSKEHGIVKIQNFVNQTLNIWDGNEWTTGTIVKSGKKRKCVIHFLGGQQFVCSPDHQFDTILTNGNHKWRKCADLKHGMHININQNPIMSDHKYSSDQYRHNKQAHNANNVYVDDIPNSFAAGRVLGRLASDGTFGVRRDRGGTYAMQIIAEHEYSIIPELEAAMSKLNAHPTKYIQARPDRTQAMATISVGSLSFVSELEQLDIKHNIHDKIFQDTELLRGFLSGFFDGDGGVGEHAIRLVFGKQYDFKQMLQNIQKSLLFFGIRSSFHVHPDRSFIDIKRADCAKFAKRIGFLNSEKQLLAEKINAIKDEHVFGPSLVVDYVEITDEYIDMYDVCNTKNGYFIADGLVTHNSAADMSKLAMVAVNTDQELRALKGQIIIPVHDELILQAPLRNARVVKKLFAYDMEHAAEDRLTIPIKCDVTCSFEWYGDELDLDKELKGLYDE